MKGISKLTIRSTRDGGEEPRLSRVFGLYEYLLGKYGITRTIRFFLRNMYIHFLNLVFGLREERTIGVNGGYLTVMQRDSGISMELKRFGSHEPLSVGLLQRALREGMVCIDIGANIGFYAVLEGRIVGKSGKIIAVEPSPKSYKYLLKNLEDNHVNFEAYNFAISDLEGVVPFKIEQASNLSHVPRYNEIGDADIIRVRSTTLDSLVSMLGPSRVDMVRMDVEGHEANIAKGWKETILRFKPMIFIEIHPEIGRQTIVGMLSFMQQQRYARAYFIDRGINEPLIAKNDDVRMTTIGELLVTFRSGQPLPTSDFHLFALPEHSPLQL